MVKIICPVCGGTGRVPTNFGTPVTINPWFPQNPYPNSPWYCSNTTTQTNSYSYFPPSYHHDKTCPACGGSGMQDCKCDCDRCVPRYRRYCRCGYKRAHDNPCSNPYIPFVSQTGGSVSTPNSSSTAIPYVTDESTSAAMNGYPPATTVYYTITCSTTPSSKSSGIPDHVSNEE